MGQWNYPEFGLIERHNTGKTAYTVRICEKLILNEAIRRISVGE